MTEYKSKKKVDVSSLSNLTLGPNWETHSVKKLNPARSSSEKKSRVPIKKKSKSEFKTLFDISITYDQSEITNIKDKIRKYGIAYSIEEIASTIISTKDRLSFKIEQSNKESFKEVLFDNKIFHTKSGAIDYIVRNGSDSVFTISKNEEEKPNGDFQTISRCPQTKNLLPPKNCHHFDNCVFQHMFEHNITVGYENYINKLIPIDDIELINIWKNTPIKRFVYEFKNKFDTGRKYESVKSLINEIDRSFTKFVTEKKRIVISGRETDNLDNVIKEHIKDFYNRNHKWKKDIFFNVLINLKKSGFHIFNYGDKKFKFANPIKPRRFNDSELSKICINIVNVIRKKKIISKKELLEYDYTETLKKDIILCEIKWMLKEGYLRQFKDGQISINE